MRRGVLLLAGLVVVATALAIALTIPSRSCVTYIGRGTSCTNVSLFAPTHPFPPVDARWPIRIAIGGLGLAIGVLMIGASASKPVHAARSE